MRYFLLGVICFLSTSCVSWKTIRYVQTTQLQDSTQYTESNEKPTFTIKKNDRLLVLISSAEKQTSMGLNFETQGSPIEMNTYTVDDSGFVDIPFAGKVNVEGLTLDEMRNKITDELKEYLSNYRVVVRYQSKTITLLGEVMKPGTYPIPKEDISIFEAISMAGDISDFGDRRKITVIRKNENKRTYHLIDLTQRTCVASPMFYLSPDDIVYVEPVKAKYWSIQRTSITFIAAISSLVLTFVTLIRTFK